MMLMLKGCPQTLDSLDLLDSLALIESQIAELRERLEPFSSDCYIAPAGCEARCNNVKRPSRTYRYNNLTSNRAIFKPEEQSAKAR